nr:hypothetical protein [Yoonia sediminilitoris]
MRNDGGEDIGVFLGCITLLVGHIVPGQVSVAEVEVIEMRTEPQRDRRLRIRNKTHVEGLVQIFETFHHLALCALHPVVCENGLFSPLLRRIGEGLPEREVFK